VVQASRPGLPACAVRRLPPTMFRREAFEHPHVDLGAVGVLAALGLTRAMPSMSIGVTATDPATYFAMAAGFLLVTIAAC
jgi:hypothetical protein